ncbi:hypothetical protein [Streptomyces hesseae]|uniref:Uncharacterized protein n=1 Tax=Streptomyces hesseae TaxID=3075519 RepID=A0ABU2SGN3_9ACTN|nr:hypothetical protein [Streptomyces sp. DSM 40473]MDT0448078.1 hypothetical protein [Streptomyces sp. DSM 40473]
MLEEALTALAAAGGAAVVQAAGTDAWTGLRQAVANWFGRGNGQRERAELERLDRTAGELETAEAAAAEQVRIRQSAAWQARIELFLESLAEAERTQAAEQLRTLLAQHTPEGGVSTGQGGPAAGGDLSVTASGAGAIAVGGSVTGPVTSNAPRTGTKSGASSSPPAPGPQPS